ncbi:hypothetical protein EPUS_08293 [Endocarpon pusillum Z07020]|uniref:ADF-H domain-containing protein n=1 Tax=Endocarpon pusillum (strain Z07020 / HMAS-L-300199) TaxID=1263415 RepID=U1GN47_ENDPU|nr:uncharacterized protein EPUS_08293 [Endocarpon pusillum Z07020]ERF73351.1 hypothetical protein EPUS_08293 [Endocarpon pusillum Z07020]
MSLNGLDEVAVIEAYQAALAEPGGWFLLKYVTRDTIDLLQRGTGGVVEVRIAIEAYEEKSPVYGLVQYRRRKVVLKYVPEGTSRLLQARLTVQFQSILEKFTPHDTVFNFTAATELTDSALSSACMLHTSIASFNSSTSSLHRHRLGEITEDVEEGGERRKSGLRHSILSDADSGSKEGRNNVTYQATATSNLSPVSHLPDNHKPSTPASLISPIPTFDKSLPATPEQSPGKRPTSRAADHEATAAGEDLIPPRLEGQRLSLDSRRSSQSKRPLALDTDRANSAYNPYKPKAKLGPRPSAQRPRTPGSRGEARPVANLPNSIRVSTRPPPAAIRPPSSASHRPISQQSNRSAHSTFVAAYDSTPPPPLPHPSVHISALYHPSNTYLINRPASPALSATTSIAASITSSAPPRITPEKRRLMKALQLRKKQQMVKTSLIKPSSTDTPSQESSGKTQIYPPAKKNEHPSHDPSSLPRLSLTAQSREPPSSTDIAPSVSAQEAAIQDHIMAKSMESIRVDSSLDSKDVDVLSSTIDSESATSEATVPSLKSTAIVQTTSPLLPPITPHNRLSIGVPSTFEKEEIEKLRQTNTIANSSTIAEEEEIDIAFKSPQSLPEPVPPIETIPEQSPHFEAATLGTVDKEAPQVGAHPQITVEGEPVPSNSAEKRGSGSAGRRTGRRGMLEQDKTIASPETSDISDDESLYDELQTAIVEEAKSVMVARSPRHAVFNRGSLERQQEPNRSISLQTHQTEENSKSTTEKAKVEAGRSSSSSLPTWSLSADSAQSLLLKKTNVSTGISKRIQALEMFSGRTEARPGSPNQAALPSPPLTGGLVKKRTSSHSPSETPVRYTNSGTSPAKQAHYPSPNPTPTLTPAVAHHKSALAQEDISNVDFLAPRRKGDSVSVTARIVEEPVESKPIESRNTSKPASMNLHPNLLVVEHEEEESPRQYEFSSATQRDVEPLPLKKSQVKATDNPNPERCRLSMSSNRSNPGQMPQSESFTKRLAMTIRHARTGSGNLPRSASDSSSNADEKMVKESRKARLIRRMSVFTAGPRRSMASAFGSNTLKHEESPSGVGQPPEPIAELSGEISPVNSSSGESHAHVVDIGDVNIQFPDTLLWKRRFMRIDDQGFLILTPPTMEANKRGISRRFHLSDIKKPSLPPLEREELPWSIVLDFEDGTCLQVACESRYAQGQVLRMLEDAHAAYQSLFTQS